MRGSHRSCKSGLSVRISEISRTSSGRNDAPALVVIWMRAVGKRNTLRGNANGCLQRNWRIDSNVLEGDGQVQSEHSPLARPRPIQMLATGRSRGGLVGYTECAAMTLHESEGQEHSETRSQRIRVGHSGHAWKLNSPRERAAQHRRDAAMGVALCSVGSWAWHDSFSPSGPSPDCTYFR